YVLVEMLVDQETLHTVNSIQGVIKFVGKDRDPQPLRQEEVKRLPLRSAARPPAPKPRRKEEGNRLLGVADEQVEEAPKEEIPFLVGQAVAITEGPFTDFNGTVEEVMV